MDNVSATLQTAMDLHRSGEIEQAEALYRNVIDEEPANADARHLLGVAAHQRGDHRLAIESILAAIAANESVPLYHSNLGAAYRTAGRLDEAIAAFQSALMLQPDFAEAHYNLALAFEELGRIDDALLGFRKTIDLAPEFADAYVNRGRLLSTRDQFDEAIACLREGLAACPDSAELSYNLGNALQATDQLEDAAAAYRDAIRLQPHVAAIHNNLGTVLKSLERFDEAAACFDQALELDPEFRDARYNALALRSENVNPDESIQELRAALEQQPDSVELRCVLASSLQKRERHDEAVPLFEEAAQRAPERPSVQFSLGFSYLSQGRHRLAESSYRRCLELDPNHHEAWNALGTIHLTAGRLNDAAECFANAIRIAPDDPIARFNLGNVHKDANRLRDALAEYDRALDIQPDLSAACVNRGVVQKRLGLLDEAIASYTRAMEIGDRDAEAGFHRALARLHKGDFERGWEEYEWRWKYEAVPRRFPQPVWTGDTLYDRALLVYAEQGVGDEIMFASCLPELIPRTRRTVLECDPRLVPLFARSFPLATVVARPKLASNAEADATHDCDVQIAIGSLPRYTRARLIDFPNRRRYLAPDPDLVRRWQSRLEPFGETLKVGISWRGGNKPEIRKRRSTALSQWKPVFSVPGVEFVNLQYGECEEELEVAKRDLDVDIHHWDDANPIRDLDGFAAQMATLDLVITIDNSTAHMAGALGVPVWTLLPYAPNWRWMAGRDDSPWYSSMRLFRQPAPEEWAPVFEEAARELAAFNSGKAARSPSAASDSAAASVSSGADIEIEAENADAGVDAAPEVAPPAESDPEADRERLKYESIWTHDIYRKKSPGLDDADKIQLIEHLRSRGVKSVLDAGCGSGKLMQRLITQHSDEFTVHGFDISKNCLDPFFDDIKDDVLTVGCLWKAADMPGEFDAVICTDVLEHIPTEHIPAVLANLRSCTRKFAYLAIALFPDGFGPKLIGEPLHLTVQPPNWWYAKISVAGFRIESQAVETHPSGQDMWLHVLATV